MSASARTRALAAIVGVLSLVLGLLGAAPAHAAPSGVPTLLAPDLGAEVSQNPVLSWSAVPAATRYRVQYSTSSAFSSSVVSTDTVNLHLTPVTDLAFGNYYWRVAAGDAAGFSSTWSSTGTFTKSAGLAPEVVGPADGTTFQYPAQTPVLQWKPSAGAKSYKVELDDELSFTGPVVLSTVNTSIVVTNNPVIQLGTTWYWRVLAVNDADRESLKSQPRSISVTWPGGQPTLTAPANTSSPAISDIVLEWQPVDGAAQYDLQVSLSPVFSGTLVADLTTDKGKAIKGTQYSPPITWLNDTYYWRVRAVDPLVRKGPWSDVWTFRRDAAAPDRPVQSFPADGATVGEWRFSWTNVPNGASYELQYSSSNSFTSFASCGTFHTSVSGHTVVSGPAVRYPNVGDGCPVPTAGTYYWRVRAVDAPPSGSTDGQVGPWSTTRAVIFSPAAATGQVPAQLDAADYLSPADCQAPACSDALPDTPELSWDAVPNATFYKVWLADDAKFTSGVRTFMTRGTHLRIRDSLKDNATDQSYYWWVQPCGGGSISAPTSCAADDQVLKETVAPAFRKLAPTVTLAAPADEATVQDVVAFSWDNLWDSQVDAAGAAGYRIQVSKDPSFSTSIDSDSAAAGKDAARVDQTRYESFVKMYAPGTYFWRVQGLDGSDAQAASAGSPGDVVGMPWSEVRTFTVLGTTPTNLQAAKPDPSASLPLLTWDSTAYVTGYKVYIYEGASDNYDGKPVTGSPFTTLLPAFAPSAGLKAGTYSWQVARLDASGNPGQLVPIAGAGAETFTVAAPTPTLLEPADGSTLSGQGVLFEWAPVPGASKYQVQYTRAGSATVNVSTVMSAFAPTGATADGQYTWRVLALDGAGNTIATSATWSFTRDGTGPVATFDVSGGSASLQPTVSVTFNEDVSGVSASTVRLVRATGNAAVQVALTCANQSGTTVACTGSDVRKVSIKPLANVVPGETHTVSVSSGVTDGAGNAAIPKAAAFRAILTVQDSTSSPKFSSGWSTVTTASASGGTVKRTGTKGASVSWTFVGSSAKVGFLAQRAAGKAAIYVDGALKATVDMYSATTTRKTYSLAVTKGQHTVKVVMLGTRNSSATSAAVNVDFFGTS